VIFRTVSLCLALVVDEVLPVRKQMSVGPNFDSSIRRIERKSIVVVGWCRGLERGRNVDRKAVSVIAEALPIGGLDCDRVKNRPVRSIIARMDGLGSAKLW
jgi:hypothetical protein